MEARVGIDQFNHVFGVILANVYGLFKRNRSLQWVPDFNSFTDSFTDTSLPP
jgi:hypothetical protein